MQAPPDWETEFLKNIGRYGTISRACRKAGVSRTTAYARRKVDTEFRNAWDVAIQDSIDALEDEARRRAVNGVKRTVSVAGQPVEQTEYSDSLLMFLLKGYRPERFRDSYDFEKVVNDAVGRRLAGSQPAALPAPSSGVGGSAGKQS
jgi:hypothetical protein